jgi:hypothetical protein
LKFFSGKWTKTPWRFLGGSEKDGRNSALTPYLDKKICRSTVIYDRQKSPCE